MYKYIFAQLLIAKQANYLLMKWKNEKFIIFCYRANYRMIYK